ncbi:MAG: ribosome maturation factor RimM [Fluviibacter sp.]
MQPKSVENGDVTQQRCVILGRVGAAYGIKGWFHLHPFADDPEAWLELPTWWISPREPDAEGLAPWRPITPESLKVHGDGLVVKLSQVNDRNGSEALRGFWIGAPRESLPETAGNEYYWADLLGLKVINTQGELLGQVDRLIETGANAVLIVKDTTAEKAHERLIPFVDQIVRNVDKAAGQILVDWAADW